MTIPGATTTERLNNAIVRLGIVSRQSDNKGVRKSIADLAKHWNRYWTSARRKLAPTELDAITGKLRNYADWYTRAYYLLPVQIRTKAFAPTDLDTGFSSVVMDRINQIREGAQASAMAGESLADVIEKNARELNREVQKTALTLGLVLIGGAILWMHYDQKRGANA